MSGKKIIFITGTDTGVGKTLLTAMLLRELRAAGVEALAMKPFCSGGREDVRVLQFFQRGMLRDEEVNPFYFRAAVAPWVELKRSRREVRLSEVVASIRRVERKCEWLLVEGSGGLMVPLGRGYLVEDLIGRLRCRVVVVARNRLGTINHTLLTVERLRRRGVRRGEVTVVLMGRARGDGSAASNEGVLRELLGGVRVVGVPELGGGSDGIGMVERAGKGVREAVGRLAGELLGEGGRRG